MFRIICYATVHVPFISVFLQILQRPCGISIGKIYRCDAFGATTGCIYGKASCIREEIQHIPSSALLLNHHAVVHLIQKQSCIDSRSQVDLEHMSVLSHIDKQWIRALNFMLFMSFPLRATLNHHLVTLYVKHSAAYVTYYGTQFIAQSFVAVIRNPCIICININCHRELRKIAVIDTATIRIAFVEGTPHLKSILL